MPGFTLSIIFLFFILETWYASESHYVSDSMYERSNKHYVA